jgi:chromosome segregation ATPase
MSKATDNQQTISQAIAALSKAAKTIQTQIPLCLDNFDELTDAHTKIGGQITSLTKLLNEQDDAIFVTAMTSLKSDTSKLQADAKSLKDIIADVSTFSAYLSDIDSAISFITKIA